MKNMWMILGIICVLAFYLNACDSGGKAPDTQLGKSSETAEEPMDEMNAGLETAKDAMDSVKQESQEFVETTKEMTGDVVETAKEMTGETVEAVKKSVGQTIDSTKGTAEETLRTATENTGSAVDAAAAQKETAEAYSEEPAKVMDLLNR